MKKISKIPVPLLPTMVGACTLANVYDTLGFFWVKHITFGLSTLLVLVYLIKMITSFETVKNEYAQTVPASLYAGFTMLLMLLGSYYFTWHVGIGKTLWYMGLILQGIHILVFTVRNVLIGFQWDTFVPSWFVTYNGIMVSAVVGGAMGAGPILTYVVYYGIAIYFILIVGLLYRLLTKEVKDVFLHTLAVVLAPCSLCTASYLSVIKEPNLTLAVFLYACVLLSLLFIFYKLPQFFAVPFSPGFAGLTFPMAIGIVASARMSGFLKNQGLSQWGNLVGQIQGIQLYVTTAIIGFVLFNFVKYLKNS